MNLPKLKILVVDDHSIIRSGIKMMLQIQKKYAVDFYEAENGESAIKIVDSIMPDIVLLDIKMPVLNGLDTLKILKRNYQDIKVIVLTSFDENYVVNTMINAGAVGYIIKDTDLNMLLDGIATVLRGEIYLCPLVTENLKEVVREEVSDDELKVQKLEGFNESPLILLTDREKEIIFLLVSGKTTLDIATELKLSKRTIDSTRLKILKKLNITNTAELVLYAIKNRLVKLN